MGGAKKSEAVLFDMKWTVDGLNRVVQAERGELGSGSIATLAEDENWTLTTVGGWALHTLDGDGDGFLTGADDLDVTGTLNVANELITRVDAAPSPTETYNLPYNDRGDLTDDGQAYKYTYDAFGRLRKVHNQSDELVAEYRYNGLGHLIAIHHDTNLDGDVDGDDRWLHLVYDDRWRVVAEHWDDEAKPHAIYVHHAGGVSGSGSYIDELAFRERDADNDTNQVLEERRYYAQNWRKDVVAMLTHDGALVEQVRYSSYGVPFGLPAGDTDSDGDFDLDDVNAITGSYDVRKDANLDGVVDVFDIIHAGNMAGGGGFVTTGRDVLGSVANANRFGYAAYLRDPAAPQWHVRHRVLRSDIGRWLTRDPAGYVDGLSLYEYVGSRGILGIDPYGLQEYFIIGPDGDGGGRQTYPGMPMPKPPPMDWGRLIPDRESVQTVLDILGCFDPTPTCDGINAAIYASDGQWGQAAISCCAMVPIVGDLAKAPRVGSNFIRRIRGLKPIKDLPPGRVTPARGLDPRYDYWIPDGSGIRRRGTYRQVGPDGKACLDYDFGHNHGKGDPHKHFWDWLRPKKNRRPGQPIEPSDDVPKPRWWWPTN